MIEERCDALILAAWNSYSLWVRERWYFVRVGIDLIPTMPSLTPRHGQPNQPRRRRRLCWLRRCMRRWSVAGERWLGGGEPTINFNIELEVDTISKESELGDEYNKVDDVIPLSMTSSDIIGNRSTLNQLCTVAYCGVMYYVWWMGYSYKFLCRIERDFFLILRFRRFSLFFFL